MEWESIDTAPKNGTVIISDDGFVKWIDDIVINQVDSIGWYSAHPNGQIRHEYENIQYSYPIKASPTVWLRITVPKIK